MYFTRNHEHKFSTVGCHGWTFTQNQSYYNYEVFCRFVDRNFEFTSFLFYCLVCSLKIREIIAKQCRWNFWQVFFYFSNCYKKSYRFRNRSIFLVKCFLLIKLLQKILSDRNCANNYGWNISFLVKIRIFLFVVFISKIQNEYKCDYFPLNEIILTMKISINIDSLIDEIVNEKIFDKI